MYATSSNVNFGEAFLGNRAFDQALSRAKRGKVMSYLTRSPRRLSNLEGYNYSGRSLGLQQVPVDQIRGTEGRQNDFDIEFNPLRSESRQRWMGVFSAWMSGAALPPIQLVKVGSIYYVRDGHHRISVARALGIKDIEANVTYLS